MENNFDLKKFLVENKLTTNSKLIKEGVALDKLMNGSDVNNDVIVAPAMSYDDEAHVKRHALRPIRKEGSNIIFTAIGQDGEEKQYAIKGGELPDLVLYTDAIKGLRETISEEWSEEKEQQLRQLADQIGFDQLMDKYAPSYVDSLPNLEDYIGAIYDSGGEIGDEFLNPEMLKADIIDYAKNL